MRSPIVSLVMKRVGWQEKLHPRDAHGRFIPKGAPVKVPGGGSAQVTGFTHDGDVVTSKGTFAAKDVVVGTPRPKEKSPSLKHFTRDSGARAVAAVGDKRAAWMRRVAQQFLDQAPADDPERPYWEGVLSHEATTHAPPPVVAQQQVPGPKAQVKAPYVQLSHSPPTPVVTDMAAERKKYWDSWMSTPYDGGTVGDYYRSRGFDTSVPPDAFYWEIAARTNEAVGFTRPWAPPYPTGNDKQKYADAYKKKAEWDAEWDRQFAKTNESSRLMFAVSDATPTKIKDQLEERFADVMPVLDADYNLPYDERQRQREENLKLRLARPSPPDLGYTDPQTPAVGKGLKAMALDPSHGEGLVAGLRHQAVREGKTPQEIADRETKAAREALSADKAHVAVRVSPGRLEKIVRQGRFKSQFETRSSGGFYSPETRSKHEATIFGFNPDDPPELRPIYGYVSSDNERAHGNGVDLNQYGDVKVILKDQVRSRTTVTMDDSLNLKTPNTLPQPIDDPDWTMGIYGTGDVPARLPSDRLDGSFHEKGGVGGWMNYVEAQVHGGVSADDIARVEFSVQPDPKVIKQLKKAGIPYVVHNLESHVLTKDSEKQIATADKSFERAKTIFDAWKAGDYEKVRELNYGMRRMSDEDIKKSTGPRKAFMAAQDARVAARKQDELIKQQIADGEVPLPLPSPQDMSTTQLRNEYAYYKLRDSVFGDRGWPWAVGQLLYHEAAGRGPRESGGEGIAWISRDKKASKNGMKIRDAYMDAYDKLVNEGFAPSKTKEEVRDAYLSCNIG